MRPAYRGADAPPGHRPPPAHGRQRGTGQPAARRPSRFPGPPGTVNAAARSSRPAVVKVTPPGRPASWAEDGEKQGSAQARPQEISPDTDDQHADQAADQQI